MPILLMLGAGFFGALSTGIGVAVENVTEKKPSTSTIGGGAEVGGLPWYVTAGLAVVGGVLLYKLGAKVLKVK